MTDLRFNCPQCQQSLEAPEEMLGTIIDCPSCGSQIKIPQGHATPPICTLSPSSSGTHANLSPTSIARSTGEPKQKVAYFTALRIGIAVLLLVVVGLSVTVAVLVRPSATRARPTDSSPSAPVEAQSAATVQDARLYLDDSLSYSANARSIPAIFLYPIADYEIISITKEAPNASEKRMGYTSIFSATIRLQGVGRDGFGAGWRRELVYVAKGQGQPWLMYGNRQ